MAVFGEAIATGLRDLMDDAMGAEESKPAADAVAEVPLEIKRVLAPEEPFLLSSFPAFLIGLRAKPAGGKSVESAFTFLLAFRTVAGRCP